MNYPDSESLKPALTRRNLLIGLGMASKAMSATTASADTNETSPTQEQTASEPSDSDYVRLTHISPDTGPVDLYTGSKPVFEEIDHLLQSKYVTYEPGGSVPVTITPAGEPIENAILETEVTLRQGGPVSLTLVGESCNLSERSLELIQVQDNYSELVSDHARLKAVHASPDAPALDYRTDDGDDLVTDLEYGEYAFSTIAAGDSVIAVHKAGEPEPLFRFEISPTPSTVYSAFAVGYLAPESAPAAAGNFPFSLGVIEDSPPSDSDA